MKAFRFPLERVMQWRRMQLSLEEMKLGCLIGRRRDLASAVERLETSVIEITARIRRKPEVEGCELNALGRFRESAGQRRSELLGQIGRCDDEIRQQRKQAQTAQRNLRLLEILKEERWHTWSLLCDRELEALASEMHLVRWVNERRPS
jgi:hypothetical protein